MCYNQRWAGELTRASAETGIRPVRWEQTSSAPASPTAAASATMRRRPSFPSPSRRHSRQLPSGRGRPAVSSPLLGRSRLVFIRRQHMQVTSAAGRQRGGRGSRRRHLGRGCRPSASATTLICLRDAVWYVAAQTVATATKCRLELKTQFSFQRYLGSLG